MAADPRADARLLTERPGWSGLKARGAQRVYVADGSQYFNRFGHGSPSRSRSCTLRTFASSTRVAAGSASRALAMGTPFR